MQIYSKKAKQQKKEEIKSKNFVEIFLKQNKY